MKYRLVDLWFAPLRMVERIIEWWTLTPYSDVPSEYPEVNKMRQQDRNIYAALSGFTIVVTLIVLTTVAILIMAAIGVIA